MAAPQISSVTAPSSVQPGETFDVQINASDPDARSAIIRALVKDADGDPAQLEKTIVISDPLTYALEDPNSEGWTFVQDSQDPSLFHVTAPSG